MDIKEFNEHLREAERLLKEVTRLQDELWAKEIARQASKRSSYPINSGRMMPWDGPYRVTCAKTSFGGPVPYDRCELAEHINAPLGNNKIPLDTTGHSFAVKEV